MQKVVLVLGSRRPRLQSAAKFQREILHHQLTRQRRALRLTHQKLTSTVWLLRILILKLTQTVHLQRRKELSEILRLQAEK